MTGIVGLYVDPPAHAVVLSIDEKSQIQALDRTQPGLPLKPGRCGTMTHDDKRHRTTTLFAALNVLDGKVIGRCMQQHRHEEFIRFLNDVERAVPPGKLVETVVDNYATHKHPKVRAWLARQARRLHHAGRRPPYGRSEHHQEHQDRPYGDGRADGLSGLKPLVPIIRSRLRGRPASSAASISTKGGGDLRTIPSPSPR
jgi:hypothetical protein